MSELNSVVTLTARQKKLVDVGEKIYTSPPTGNDMAFVHSVLCQVGLPRSKVDGKEFMRRSGEAWINVQAGYLDEGNGPVEQPLPYGALPRLALAWISTFAIRKKTQEIPIGGSAAEFLRLMKMGKDGRRYDNLRKQMHALAAARLQLGLNRRTYNGQPVQQFDAWVPPPHTQKRDWPRRMVLSDGYYKSLIESAVPLDERALHALKGSALALDVYAWLAQRLWRIEGRVRLYWNPLRQQFGQEYQGKDPEGDFRKEFLLALKKVKTVYPQADVKQVTGGLLLLGSPPPIPKKTSA